MHQRLKRWESPRKEGRNKKGKGGTARARQLKKQTQMMRQRLKEDNSKDKKRREDNYLPAFFVGCVLKTHPAMRLCVYHVPLLPKLVTKALIRGEIALKADGNTATVAAATMIVVASLTRLSAAL